MFLLLALGPSTAFAQSPTPKVQLNTGLQVGLVGQGSDAWWQETLFHGGLRGDVLWGRRSPFDWGFGPMFGVSTNHFRDLNLAAGGSLLIPVSEYLPFVVQAGPYLRKEDAWAPGVFASLFWGSRSFNYHGIYGMAGGLVAEARYGFGDTKERSIVLAAHLDLQAVALPVVLLINAFR